MHYYLFFSSLFLLLTSCSPLSREADSLVDSWPIFRGNPSLSGYADLALPALPALLWSYKEGVRTASSPVVKQGVVYWCNNKGRLVGVGPNGLLQVEYNLGTSVEATPMILDSVLYIGRNDGFLCAFSLNSRQLLWTFSTEGQISGSPNWIEVEGRKQIVFGSYDNYMYCVDALTGVEHSRFESGYYIHGAMARWREYLFFGGCDATVRMVSPAQSAIVDSLQAKAYIPSSPAIEGDFAYVSDYSGNLYELKIEPGRIAESRVLVSGDGENAALVSTPACSPTHIYYLSSDSYLRAIDRTSHQEVWKFHLSGTPGESSPLVCRDRVLICSKSGQVAVVNAADGSLLWEYDCGEQIVASPAVIAGRFFVLTARGTLFCFGEASAKAQ